MSGKWTTHHSDRDDPDHDGDPIYTLENPGWQRIWLDPAFEHRGDGEELAEYLNRTEELLEYFGSLAHAAPCRCAPGSLCQKARSARALLAYSNGD